MFVFFLLLLLNVLPLLTSNPTLVEASESAGLSWMCGEVGKLEEPKSGKRIILPSGKLT